MRESEDGIHAATARARHAVAALSRTRARLAVERAAYARIDAARARVRAHASVGAATCVVRDAAIAAAHRSAAARADRGTGRRDARKPGAAVRVRRAFTALG